MIQHTKKILQTWLFAVAIGHILAGFALPFIAYSSAFDYYADHIREIFWAGQFVPAEAEMFQRWIVALFGPTVASWGVLMAYLVYTGTRSNNQWPWNVLLLAVMVWAPADMLISLMHDFWLHVYIDIVAVVAIAVPALILRTNTYTMLSK